MRTRRAELTVSDSKDAAPSQTCDDQQNNQHPFCSANRIDSAGERCNRRFDNKTTNFRALISKAFIVMSEQPWYQDGLNFTCSGCGNCCTGAPGAVWVTDEELQAIADLLDKPIGEVRLFHTRSLRGRVSLTEYANGDCTFFDGNTRGCKVYAARPVQCRTWPFWNSNLDSPESWEEVKRDCPGAGSGKFFSLEEIERQADAFDI